MQAVGKSRERKERNMTEGCIWKHILFFSLPLMIGNLFQQLYNTVDTIVVGNYVGKEALAAVGSVDSIIFMFIGLFSGLATGAGVVISQYYGAKDEKNVSEAVHTTIALTIVMSIGTTILSLLLVPFLLNLMNTPDDVYDLSATYLRIYFSGMAGLLFYNMGSGIMRAVGDSRRPLYFLIFSALTNIVLDLLFVMKYQMGVAGVGYATIISQGLSAVLILIVLCRETHCYRVVPRKIRMNRSMLERIINIGFPAAFQMAVTSFSNVFVHSYINSFGSAAMAGWSSYGKVDKFCLLPIQSLALGVTTFTGQNVGAGRLDRVRRGTKTGLMMSIAVSICIIIPVWIFAGTTIRLFSSSEDVLSYGTLFVRLMMPFYVSLCINQIFAGTLRGVGNTKAPMLIMMGSFIVFRQIYLFIISRLSDSIIPIALGYPFGWILCSACLVFYYRRTKLTRYAVTGSEETG
ncbi:MAG: MATE family efflux transporter [Eubacteriales bacterium]|nr:MATE family efflux transporter [Eubacteriales bacterium]